MENQLVINLDDRVTALTIAEHETRQTSKTRTRHEIYQSAFEKNRNNPVILQFAKALAWFLEQKEVIVLESDVLAGHAQYYDYVPSIPVNMVSEFDPSVLPPVKFNIEQEVKAYLTDHQNEIGIEKKASLLDQYAKGIRIKLFKRFGSGHVIAGYDQIIEKGYRFLIDAARQKMTTGHEKEVQYAEAIFIVCQATSEYILRYALKARMVADKALSREAKHRLNEIAAACEWVADNPPRTFFEAVQLVWLTHEVLVYENFTGSMSLGRLDQYLYPFYEHDTKVGKLDLEEASLYIEALWLKLSNLVKGYQNVTLGGYKPDGSDAVNDLTFICMRASRKLKMDQPLLSVRWHPKVTHQFWDEVQALIETGIGFPALFNDEVAIPAKLRLDIDKKDALNYGIVGCVELSIPGKEYANTEGFRFNWAKVLELVLNGGKCTCTSETIDLANNKNLDTFTSFEQFYAWFKDEFQHYLEIGLAATNMLDENFGNHWPNPFLSSLMQGCFQKARDVTAGGTIYNNSSANACGMASLSDSLLAIKNVVFTEELVTLSILADALRNDFQGYERLRAQLQKCPKFGNDDDEVDSFFIELTNLFVRTVEAFNSPRGGRFQVGLYTVSDHAHMGVLTGALPDGRKRGVSLSNGTSPAQGADVLGPTAVVKSVTKIDHRLSGNGLVLDLKFHPDFFKSDKHRQAFRQLIESYFALGGLEIQFNVVSRETLLNAQKNPDQYRNLVVRVSGFSAYFTTLDKPLQDEIIARTEYSYL